MELLNKINKVLPIDGWEATELDYTRTGVTIKFEFRDVALLLCPHDRCPGPTIHRRYYILVRDLPLGIFQTTLKTARESGLKPFESFAHRLSGHVKEFLNYFRYKMTSGVIEGLNSRIAKIQFQCRGLKDISHLYLRLREISCSNFIAALQPVPYS